MTTDTREQLLRDMVRIRRIEETLAELYPSQEMRTPTHFSIGQEAVAVGVCSALRRTDAVYSGHRCHAHYLAKGGDLHGMVAELYGRETGCARGRGGSVHLNDPDAGVVASSAILGQTMAVAVGTALAFVMDGRDDVVVTFFGDVTFEEGIFHESLNFAVMRRTPVLLECTTYRWREHVGPLWDYDKGYRSKAEVDSWIARCPIRRAAERLATTPARLAALERESQVEVDAAVAAARTAPF